MLPQITNTHTHRRLPGLETYMKTVTRYEVRIYGFGMSSKRIGFKGVVVEYKRACKIVKRLKRMGLDAYKAQISIIV